MTRLRIKEPFNTISHLLGAVLAIPGLIWLLMHSQGDPWRIVGFSVYGTSLFLLYSASTVYHWLPVSPSVEDWLRRLDHIAIFLLIAGTYTPICLVTLRGPWGWSLFATVWVIGVTGIVTKVFCRHLAAPLTAGLYVAMGSVAVVAVSPLLQALPPGGFKWMVAGGLSYVLGAVVYALERPDPLPAVLGHHGVFHIFVLGGSALHFVFMLRGVLPVV